ncbi:MAG TPA: mechanosensitive ion channel family protein [Burkholderiaceae bacterium]|jgi:moderate conductance mechanosensitive channel|nr:mechanosensitive ion channel family protein [Burkholderiaceae bacterium]
MPDEIEPFRIGMILAMWLLGWVGLQLLMRMLRRVLVLRVEAIETQKRFDTMMRAFRYTANAIVLIIVAVLVLAELGVSIAPILGAAGVAGIAVGFAAQSLVKDFFRGIFLLLENQVRVGDVVEVAGRGGFVEEVTLRYVRLRDYEGNVLFVPNGEIGVVVNRSVGFAFAVLDIGIAYRSDVDKAIALLREVANQLREDDEWRARILEPIEIAGVDRWADSAVIIRGRIKVVPLQQWNVKREMLRRLKLRFDREDIEIPYPHMMLYLGDRNVADALAVRDDANAQPSRIAG